MIKAVKLMGILLMFSNLAVAENAPQTVDFERKPRSHFFDETAWLDYGLMTAFTQGVDRTSLDNAVYHSGSRSLRVSYPRGAVGPAKGGYQAAVILPAKRQYYLSYWLRFDEHFSWGGDQQGGKLPGLGADALCSGGDRCSGSNGFTARYMWRKDGAAVLYLYHMHKPHKWGEDLPLTVGSKPVYFQPGQWVHLLQRVKTNSGKHADGEVQVWVNGAEALHRTGLQFADNGQLIDRFYFSTFHGGNTPDWGPQRDSHIWYDDIRVGSSADDVLP